MARILDYWLTRWGIPALLVLVLAAVSEYWIHLESIRIDQQEHSAVLGKVATIRARLDNELNATISLANGLVGFIAVEDAITAGRATRILATLHRLGKHIRVIAIAPDNVITYIYPLKGNETVLGRHYQSLPGQWESVEKAVSTRKSVLSGPVNLVQGGVGLVNRTPVFNDDEKYWGMLSVVLDFDKLFAAAGMQELADDVRYAMRGKDGLGAQGEVFFGDPVLFSKAPVLMQIAVPGGTWELAALPAGGWGGKRDFMFFHMIGLAIALFSGALSWLFLLERWKTRLSLLRDGLTGLPNRRLAIYRLEVELNRCERQNKHFAVLFIDLDGFKPVNDTHGHKAGDYVLQAVGKAMSQAVRKSDLVARLGGDEFLVILTDVEPVQAPFEIAGKIQAALRQPILLGNGTLVRVGGSIGIAVYPDHGSTADAMMAAADDAMYLAKREGKISILPPCGASAAAGSGEPGSQA
jgi:diguanylate cyclase (GGDEF)-like protein